MKELSIEEKAKAIDVVKQMVADGQVSQDVAEKYFPELAESEDEKIRKEILDCFKSMKQQGCFPLKHKEQYDAWIAYLEKQGQTFTKKDIDNAWVKGVCDANHELEKQREQKSAWSDEDELQVRQIKRIVNHDGCTKKLQNKIADWFESIKKRVQPKPELSEEDEKQLQKAIECTFDRGYLSTSDWLKSLRPQSTWKPNNEQIRHLQYACENGTTYSIDVLKELLEQLKALL